MKVDAIITSDWHLRDSQPVCRKDNYFETMLGKIKWVSELQQKYDCPVLHAGDLFDKYEPKSKVLGYLMTRMPEQFYTVLGNHDLQNHNIEMFEKSGVFVLKEAQKIKAAPFGLIQSPFSLTGYAYSQKIPSNQRCKVMMCHEMIYQSLEHWQKENGSQALTFLKKYKGYQLIVTGHNHKPFTAQHEGRLLVNPGSLMRMTADQKDYKPRVYLWNKETNTVKIEYVPIDSEAVEITYLEKTKERDERINKFIAALPKGCGLSGVQSNDTISFEKNLENYLANNRVRSSVKSVIYECVGR